MRLLEANVPIKCTTGSLCTNLLQCPLEVLHLQLGWNRIQPASGLLQDHVPQVLGIQAPKEAGKPAQRRGVHLSGWAGMVRK